MLKSDVENAEELAQRLFYLVQEEGSSVQIVNPNPDFDGPAATIYVSHDFEEAVQYFGDSTLDCLKQANDALQVQPTARQLQNMMSWGGEHGEP